MRHRWVAAGVVALLLAGVWLYYSYDPSTHPYPRCYFHQLTGLDCPGCGSQRALHSLFHGDVRGAWQLNAGLMVALVLLPLYVCAEWFGQRFGRLHRWLTSAPAAYTLAGAIVGWGILRNILN